MKKRKAVKVKCESFENMCSVCVLENGNKDYNIVCCRAQCGWGFTEEECVYIDSEDLK